MLTLATTIVGCSKSEFTGEEENPANASKRTAQQEQAFLASLGSAMDQTIANGTSISNPVNPNNPYSYLAQNYKNAYLYANSFNNEITDPNVYSPVAYDKDGIITYDAMQKFGYRFTEYFEINNISNQTPSASDRYNSVSAALSYQTKDDYFNALISEGELTSFSRDVFNMIISKVQHTTDPGEIIALIQTAENMVASSSSLFTEDELTVLFSNMAMTGGTAGGWITGINWNDDVLCGVAILGFAAGLVSVAATGGAAAPLVAAAWVGFGSSFVGVLSAC